MKKCLRCKEMREIHRYYTNQRGNPMGVCAFCKSAESRKRYAATEGARRREERARQNAEEISNPLALNPSKRLKRQCSVFPGFFFAGDL